MIIVLGRVQTDSARRSELVRIGQALAAASRAEPGCISYRLYADTEQENELVFVEEWEDREALNRHFASAHIREFMQASSGVLVGPPDVKFHTIASSMDLAEVVQGRS